MKRIFKSSTNKQIMGVCGGIGEYFNIDPTFIRLIFGISFFVFGVGFLPYIILGLVLPYDYQVNGGRYDQTRPFKRDEGYVYRNSREEGADLFSSLNQRKTSQPKDVTPKEEDDWSDF